MSYKKRTFFVIDLIIVIGVVMMLAGLLFAYCSVEPIAPKSEPAPVTVASVVPIARQVMPCDRYATMVRTAHFHYFGLDYPYWYGIGQLQQESSCREKAKSFDGGMGLAQFMPRTWKEISGAIAVSDPYNPNQATKAQAYYMSRLHRLNWDGALWLTYCFYNSGPGTMKSEYRRAGSTDYAMMKSVCSRRIIELSGGRKLNLCDVGYDYPVRVARYGEKYRMGIDKVIYW